MFDSRFCLQTMDAKVDNDYAYAYESPKSGHGEANGGFVAENDYKNSTTVSKRISKRSSIIPTYQGHFHWSLIMIASFITLEQNNQILFDSECHLIASC